MRDVCEQHLRGNYELEIIDEDEEARLVVAVAFQVFGRYVMNDVDKVGGIPMVMKALLDAGLMHGDVPRHLDFDPIEQPLALLLGSSDRADLPAARDHFDPEMLSWYESGDPASMAAAILRLVRVMQANPTLGILAHWMRGFGIPWNPLLDGNDALMSIGVHVASAELFHPRGIDISRYEQIALVLRKFRDPLLAQALVPPRLGRLPLQRAPLLFDLEDDVVDARQVLLRRLELELRRAPPRLPAHRPPQPPRRSPPPGGTRTRRRARPRCAA